MLQLKKDNDYLKERNHLLETEINNVQSLHAVALNESIKGSESICHKEESPNPIFSEDLPQEQSPKPIVNEDLFKELSRVTNPVDEIRRPMMEAAGVSNTASMKIL